MKKIYSPLILFVYARPDHEQAFPLEQPCPEQGRELREEQVQVPGLMHEQVLRFIRGFRKIDEYVAFVFLPGEFPRDEAFADPPSARNQQRARAFVIVFSVREPVIHFASQHACLPGNQFPTKKQVGHT